MKKGSEEIVPDELGEGAEDLLLLARKLETLREGVVLSQEVEDRIFAKIEGRLDEELKPVGATSRAGIRERVAALGSHLPKPLIQRRADALATMIERLKSGNPIAATGEMAAMVAVAGALRPLPTVEPSPSFVDWLEVRLSQAEVPNKRAARRVAAFNQMLRNWKLQTGFATAAASVIAVAIFALQGIQGPTTQAPSPRGPLAAPPTVADTQPVEPPASVARLSQTQASVKLDLPSAKRSTGSKHSDVSPPIGGEPATSGEGVFTPAGMPEDGPKRAINRLLAGVLPSE